MSKRALITGITGQDGSYLADLLLEKGYEVFGMVRRSSTENFERIDHLTDRITLVQADLLDPTSLAEALEEARPDEVYNLGAQSFVPTSWKQPVLTAEFTAVGVTRLLEAIRRVDPGIRFYQASSSEMFGKVREVPQNEQTPFYPRSPYGVAKVYAHFITVNYRESYGLLRGLRHPLQPRVAPARAGVRDAEGRATASRASSSASRTSCVSGNLDAKRDWGYAGDYVEGMWMMLQQDEPEDFVLATGEEHSVREFAEAAFGHVGLDHEQYVKTDPRVPAAGRGRPSRRRCLEGPREARLGAARVVRGARRADGRRRPGTALARGAGARGRLWRMSFRTGALPPGRSHSPTVIARPATPAWLLVAGIVLARGRDPHLADASHTGPLDHGRRAPLLVARERASPSTTTWSSGSSRGPSSASTRSSSRPPGSPARWTARTRS